jgi:hypothetical protein
METLSGTSVRTMHRTAEQAKAHEEALTCRSSEVKLELDGKDIDPSTALRLQRKGIVEQFNAQRKRARLQRWIEGSNALAKLGVPIELEADVTITAGEVWLYALSATVVVPAVAIPFHSFKNGVRPWTSLAEPMKLKALNSAQLVVRRATND